MAETASDAMVDRLLEWGVDTVFGLPGDGINGFMEALRKRQDRIRYIHVRHGEVGAMAAVGYAKFTGRLGVCSATAAPGAAHMLNGILDARVEQAPILAIPGMTYHEEERGAEIGRGVRLALAGAAGALLLAGGAGAVLAARRR